MERYLEETQSAAAIEDPETAARLLRAFADGNNSVPTATRNTVGSKASNANDNKFWMQKLCTWSRVHEVSLSHSPCLAPLCLAFQSLLGRGAETDLVALNKGMVGAATKWLSAVSESFDKVVSTTETVQFLVVLLTELSRIRESDKAIQTAGTVRVRGL